jgi:PAS domain S-box-containing protein
MPIHPPDELVFIAAAADALPVGVFVAAAPSGAFTYANQAFSDILGMAPVPEAKVGAFSPSYGIFTYEGTPYPEEQLPFARALREKTKVTVDDIVIHRRDGRKVYVRAFAQPLWDSAGIVTHILIAFIDISAEVLARSQAAAMEERMLHLLAHAPLILFAFDRQGVVTVSEGRGLAGLGFRPQELIGRSVFEMYANDPDLTSEARRALAGEEIRVTRHMGSITLETTLSPIRGAGGEVDGVIGVSIDVTERVKAHARLVQAERLASMGTLSATVAHEINNPLTYVLANLERIATRLSDPEPTAAALSELVQTAEQARDGADRVRRIVRALQFFSRHDDERNVAVDVRVALGRALAMADNAIRHRARLVTDLQQVPAVLGSDLRLGQVFVNLLLNAAQAIPEGRADENEIRVRLGHNEARKAVVVAVEDTGSGIAADVKPRIFEPFFTTKPIGAGTGLGLSICYGIVQQLGGSIEVDSVVGTGSTFRVYLPSTGDRVAIRPAVAADASGALARGRFLIIDDNETVARTLALLLNRQHDTEVSLNPRASLQRILAGERFDVIFCDLMMPDMTGMDFYGALAGAHPEQAGRVVFISGGAFTPAARAFIEAGHHVLLEKPFDKRAIDAILERYVGRKKELAKDDGARLDRDG